MGAVAPCTRAACHSCHAPSPLMPFAFTQRDANFLRMTPSLDAAADASHPDHPFHPGWLTARNPVGPMSPATRPEGLISRFFRASGNGRCDARICFPPVASRLSRIFRISLAVVRMYHGTRVLSIEFLFFHAV